MASGLRWISVMLLAPIPWDGRVWALPFLAALAPSERFAHGQGRRHKKLTDWARQLLVLVARVAAAVAASIRCADRIDAAGIDGCPNAD